MKRQKKKVKIYKEITKNDKKLFTEYINYAKINTIKKEVDKKMERGRPLEEIVLDGQWHDVKKNIKKYSTEDLENICLHIADFCGLYDRRIRKCENIGCTMCDLGVKGYEPFSEEKNCYEHMLNIARKTFIKNKED